MSPGENKNRPVRPVRRPQRHMSGGHRGGVGRPVEKAKDFKGTVKRLSGYLKPYTLSFILAFVLILCGTIINTAAPKLLGAAIDSMFVFVSKKVPVMNFRFIAKILLLILFLQIINAFFTYIYQRLLTKSTVKIVYNLRRDIDLKLSKLPLRYFDTMAHGEIMSRITNDTDNINNALQQSLPQLFSSITGIIGALVMMIYISPSLTLIAVLILPLSFAVTTLIAGNSRRYFIAQQNALGELNGHVEEMLSGHVIVKSFCYEKESIKRFDEINKKLYNAGWKAQFISEFLFPLMNFINNLGYVAICVAGGIMVAKKTIKIGDVQAFIQYIRMFTQPVAQSASMINTMQTAVASAERVFEILNQMEEPSDANLPDAPERPEGAVEFKNVKFGYTPDTFVFDGLDLKVDPGHTVAIVGPTGAGKTTMVNLLMRFYDVKEGSITIDGMDVSSIKRSSLRRMFGMVLQDTWLFSGTIKANISYGKPNAADEEIIAAAKTAKADHFIRSLPDGYNTILNEGASNISHGEKQLITIARAVLSSPAMMILDEATSSVDTRTEQQIQRAMLELMKDRTSFVIAHRLSTIRDAELILVMNKGKIVEKGTHESLLEKKGFYYELYNAQFMGITT
jgi:ATP-binding cassette subfamily B protein